MSQHRDPQQQGGPPPHQQQQPQPLYHLLGGGGGGHNGQQRQPGQGEGTVMGNKQAGFLGNKVPRRLDGPPRAAPNSLTPAQPAPPQQTQPTTVFPALHLTPLNGTFVPKQISLDPPGARVKIGRQTNAKTIPNGTNGYFDSKVLSRAHAEVWSEDGKQVFIKDVKSSNGTFINGERLSPESSESDVFELHTDDIVEFGIDILTDDTKTIVHHKVAAKVHLVLNADDAVASSREINNWFRSAGEAAAHQQQQQQQVQSHGGPQAGGGMGGGMARGGGGRGQRPGGVTGQNGLSFEHVLSRLQGELQKSRDTNVNLSDINSTLGQVHDTLGGGAPPSLPPGAGLPGRGGPSAFPPRDNPSHAQSIAALQQQLAETQTSLQGHVGKIRDLEGLLAEHDVIKREVGSLRSQMEEAQQGMAAMMREREAVRSSNGRESPVAALLEAQEAEDDDDDAASISSVDTISPSRPNGVKIASREATPNGGDEPDATDAPSSPPPAPTPAVPATNAKSAGANAGDSDAREALLAEQNAKLVARLEALSLELEEATRLGTQLREQHASASLTIKALEERIAGLEKAVEGRVAEAEGRVEERWTSWRERFEDSWRSEREGWEAEREGLRKAVREWEEGKERDRRDREERAQRRAARRAARAEREALDADEEDDEDEDGSSDESSSEEEGDSPSTSTGPTSSSKRSPSRGTKPRRRSASPTSSPSALGDIPLKNLPSALASSAADAVAGGASDSDSTIGDKSRLRQARQRDLRSVTPTPARLNGRVSVEAGEHDATLPNQHPHNQQQGGLPFSLAGAVVVIAVAVGYGAAMKLKE
ncbi:hypothetical protein JCM10213_000592 [Rhodosporidiobolus nylandii]